MLNRSAGWCTAACLTLAAILSASFGCAESESSGLPGVGGIAAGGNGTGDAEGGFGNMGASSSGGGTAGSTSCADPVATVRDFKIEHPDFQDYAGDAPYPGIVEPDLGADNKPVYAHDGSTDQTSGPEAFAQWYNDVPDVNLPFTVAIPLTEVSPGTYRYENLAFFPIDGEGWGNEGNPHNYHFTTEIHTMFVYRGGEVFTFTGDDDLWLFVNRKLALDLGGLHPSYSGTVDFDAQAADLGISVDGSYQMDVFHAERRTSESHFTVETNIDCFVPPPA
jgi:fibro-slime domain-containing protein